MKKILHVASVPIESDVVIIGNGIRKEALTFKDDTENYNDVAIKDTTNDCVRALAVAAASFHIPGLKIGIMGEYLKIEGEELVFSETLTCTASGWGDEEYYKTIK